MILKNFGGGGEAAPIRMGGVKPIDPL